jgi:predicted nucleotidyltransferase component of viral defense system
MHDEGAVGIVDVDIAAWVEEARPDPVRHRERQAAEVLLAAVGLSPKLNDTLVLKGGTLMALAFRSTRVTGDIDFTAQCEPEGFVDDLREELDNALPKAALGLGYLDLLLKVQSLKKRPRAASFLNHDFPALAVKIAYALKGSPDESHLHRGTASKVLEIEISFRDQVYAFQELNLTDAHVTIKAFSFHEMIAEKTRALIQQPIRDRHRRQDVYDIALLLESHALSLDDQKEILSILRKKCATRGIEATATTFDNPEIKFRAKRDWDSMSLELQSLPDFDERYAIVERYYKSLPW